MEIGPYRNDVEYLEDQLHRLELRIDIKLADKNRSRGEAGLPNETDIHQSTPAEAVRLACLDHEIALKIEATRKAGRSVALERVVEEYALDAFERDLLVLALAPNLDLKFADLYDRVAYKFRGRSIDTALSILCSSLAEKVAARRYFMFGSRLLDHHLLLIERDRYRAEEDILNLELKLPRRVMSLILGSEALDESLASFSKLIDPTIELDQVVLPTLIKSRIVRTVENHDEFLHKRSEWGFDKVISYGRGIILLFAGAPGTGKTMMANALAKHLGKRLLLVDAERLYDRVHTVESNIENVFREAKLQNSVLFFDECEMLFADRRFGNSGVAELLTALERFDGIAILATNLAPALDEAMDRRILLRVDFELPSPELRERIWQNHLPREAPVGDDVDVRLLARNYEFAGGYIKNAVLASIHEVLSRHDATPQIRHADLENACRMQLRQKLGHFTDRIVPQLGLASVVLPDEIREQLEEVVESSRHRATVFDEWGLAARLSTGRGLAVLFQGEPGTGKSLSAEALAYELAKPLYRVSIPAIVSKFVGETEKNIKAVFTAAREGQSLLFFDEADALFSRRTQVIGALDKYTNMETNLLLQELERFDGIVVLATNLIGNLDPAFERRIAYRIRFPFPDAQARARIWESLLPPQAPTSGILDFEFLGRKYVIAGGHIKNAVLKAAYRAARLEGSRRAITTALLARAAEEEIEGGFSKRQKFGFESDDVLKDSA